VMVQEAAKPMAPTPSVAKGCRGDTGNDAGSDEEEESVAREHAS
jgi:hypothetical protein